jgi:hypothetical protein
MQVRCEVDTDSEWWEVSNAQIIESLKNQIKILESSPNTQNDVIVTWELTVK